FFAWYCLVIRAPRVMQRRHRRAGLQRSALCCTATAQHRPAAPSPPRARGTRALRSGPPRFDGRHGACRRRAPRRRPNDRPTNERKGTMGLFDKLKGKKSLRTEDEVLVTEAMLAICMADGDDQYEETNLVRAFMNTLPELKDKDQYQIYEKAEKNVKLHGAMG